MPATWKRPRLAPIQGPKLPPAPPVWKRGKPARRVIRGPLAKLMGAAIVLAVALAPQPASAQFQTGHSEPDTCDMASGPENVTLGALLYVANVFEDAAEKQAMLQSDAAYRAYYGVLPPVETHNDYLCDVPRAAQPALLFLTEQLLVFILDVMPLP